MNKKAIIFKALKYLFFLAGFPLMMMVMIIIMAPMFGTEVLGNHAQNWVIVFTVMGVILLIIHFLLEKFIGAKGRTHHKLVLVVMSAFSVLCIMLPSAIYDAAMRPKYEAARNKLVGEVDVKDFNAVQGWHRDFTKCYDGDVSMYKSMNEAYHAFDALAIEIALDKPDMLKAITTGDFPINLAATLLLKTSAIKNGNDHNLSIDKIIDMNLNSVIMALLPLVSGDGPIDNAKINDVINSVLVYKEFDGIRWNIFNILGNNMLFPDIDPNAEIVQTVNGQKTVIGASLGYQDMAWLDGIPMMFFIPLMSMRVVFYVFAALLALFAAIQYYAAERYSNKFSKTFSYIMLKP